jgi:hypothetical protein
MSTSAQPLGTRPHVLNHMDVILNRSLSQLSPQENHLEYHLKPDSTESMGVQRQKTTLTQLSHRGEYTHHMGTPNTGARLNSVQRRTIHPITWAHPTLGSLIGRLNSITEENVPWKMSHDASIINNCMV